LVPLTLTQIALAAGAVTVGATLQGSIGFGLGLVAAPLLVLIDPRFIPAPLLLASVVLTVLLTHREWRSVQFRDLGWAIGGRMVGIAAAITALLLISPNRIALFFGVLILLMVGLTASGLHLPPTPRTLLGAGMLSGFSGTAVSIGGPPMALVLQRESGARLRGTLSAFFVVGISMSLVGLRIAGRLGRTELLLSLALLPGILLGYLISRHTARLLDRGYTRSAVLAVSGAAGVVVIIKQLI
jgi:uncharacterized membrane protein YfcA